MSKFTQTLKRIQSIYPAAVMSESHGHTFFIDSNMLILLAFRGRSSKAVVRLSFKSQEKLDNYLASFKAEAQRKIDKEAKRAAQQKAYNEVQIKPDSIYVSSWGYEQTNVSFYQIIAVNGCKVTFRKIAQDKKYDNQDSGQTVAVKDKFVGDSFNLRIGKYGFRLDTVETLRFWDGSPVYWSSYH